MSTTITQVPTAVQAAETRYLGIQTKFAAVRAEIADAERRRDLLQPEADAAAAEIYVLRATAEAERLIGVVALDLASKIEAARAEVERCDAQYTAATGAWLAALEVSQRTGAPEVRYRPDGSAFTMPPSAVVPNADDVLAATLVVRSIADDEVLAARVRLMDLEKQFEMRLRLARATQNATAEEAHGRGIRDRLMGRMAGWNRND